MDLLGTIMGLVTIPMALLTLGSIAGGGVLLVTGHAMPVLWGALAFVFGVSLAPLLERLVVLIDEAAVRRKTVYAPFVAAVSGGFPMLVILAWEMICFHFFRSAGDSELWFWLWSYGIAMGPWTIFALRVSRFRRTLCSIRAYAGHLAYWLLSALVVFANVSLPGAAIAMLVPAILPFTVGMLLAVADRDALTNVRI